MTPARATFTLAVGSLIALAASALSAKVIALLTGPEGVGTVGLLASLLSIGALVGGFGVGVGVVRAVAKAATNEDWVRIGQLHVAARLAVLIVSGLVALMLVIFRNAVALAALGDGQRGWEVTLVACAVVFTCLAGVEVSLINGLHRVRDLATLTAGMSVLAAASLVAVVALVGMHGAAAGILIGSILGWLVAVIYASRISPGRKLRPESGLPVVVGQLLKFGGPFTVSQVVGTGAQLTVPFIVLALLQTSDVGLYRAATTISVAYLAFLLNAMAQDYFPRVSAVTDDRMIADVARRQLRLVLKVSMPLILLAYALAPLVIRILYTADFAAASEIIRWQLVGDVLKLPAWTLSFVLLARASSGRFLVTELIGGVALIVLSLVAIGAVGVVGAGIGYASAYAMYYVTVSLAARRFVPIHVGREELAVIVACVGLVAASLLMPSAGELAISGALVIVATAWFAAFGSSALRSVWVSR